ncbi:hypothetical protein [Streptomyces erythrochromogenes]|uniref:hypothetical protein n=1 Tax=Streptomyces erythrochromogenes TaxID=285574 RepID=UPI00380363AB
MRSPARASAARSHRSKASPHRENAWRPGQETSRTHRRRLLLLLEPPSDVVAVPQGLLALIDLEPEQAAAQGRVWRDLPHHRIRHLRRIKGLIPWLVVIRPHLEDEVLVAAVGAWEAVRPQFP